MKSGVLNARTADLPQGSVTATYSITNVQDRPSLSEALQQCLPDLRPGGTLRAGLCLPDGMFRVQVLEFDEFPAKAPDQERLIRWRLQKAAAFDLADTVLRYQILRRRDKGFTILVCIAKSQALLEFEQLLLGLGIEPWALTASSFSVLNFYTPYMAGRSAVYALAHILDDSFVTIIAENGDARFYRFKEMKRGSSEDAAARLLREIEDSLHFYSHMDRSQQSQVTHLYISGEPAVRDAVAASVAGDGGLEVQVLDPASVLVTAGTVPEMAAALGAGASV